MALATMTPPMFLGPKVIRDTSATTITLDANGEYVAYILQAPKTGTIDRLHFYATTVTADGDGLRARIETVDGSTGNPSGTLVSGSAEVTIATTTANSWNRSGAGLGAAVTCGDYIAVKLLSPATGTTFNGVIRSAWTLVGPGMTQANQLFPYVVNAIPTATKASAAGMVFALEYDDGTTPFMEGAMPIASVTSTNFSNASTPDERGNLFQVPGPCRVVGAYHQVVPTNVNAAYDVVLYSAADAELASVSVDGDLLRLLAGPQSLVHLFPTPVELASGTNYRLVIRPTTAVAVSKVHMAIDTSAGGVRLREAVVGGTSWKLTTRADAGAWTDTDDAISGIGAIVDQIDDGAGSGGGGGPLIGGRLVR